MFPVCTISPSRPAVSLGLCSCHFPARSQISSPGLCEILLTVRWLFFQPLGCQTLVFSWALLQDLHNARFALCLHLNWRTKTRSLSYNTIEYIIFPQKHSVILRVCKGNIFHGYLMSCCSGNYRPKSSTRLFMFDNLIIFRSTIVRWHIKMKYSWKYYLCLIKKIPLLIKLYYLVTRNPTKTCLFLSF